MEENRSFILSVVAILCFVIIAGVLFIQNNSLSKQISLGLQTLAVNQQNDITAVNNKINSLEEKINLPAEKVIATTTKENSQVLYENTKYGFRVVVTDKCSKGYFSVKETKNHDELDLELSVSVPGDKDWGGPWFSWGIISVDGYNKMEADEIRDKPSIELTLKNDYLVVWYSPQDGPTRPEGCFLDIEKI
ncbi:MAG TPA: hypothetical protein P5230_01730 [Candidatus Magasanikbacteria bacterium]|nr:hypothetical protein [Candidatus Magasanikbacteria bacterium]